MDRFFEYRWPGSVRELKSALEYAYVIAEGSSVDEEHLPHQIMRDTHLQPAASPQPMSPHSSEKSALIQALRKTGGNHSQAARILGINRVTVWNRMKKYGIDIAEVLNA
jgi:transcriptional regulator of acetoin/glycerol metabolism